MNRSELREAVKPPPYPVPDLSVTVGAPSYGVALDWMRTMKGRRVTYDFWARGNYVRRLIHNQHNGISPLLVRVQNLKQVHWAHRRLALLGTPVEYIYSGTLDKAWVKHILPLDIELDAGWGYLAFMGTVLRSPEGRRCVMMLGHARLLPEALLDWLVDEASEEFQSGQVFISSAQSIGLGHNASTSDLADHLQLTGGSALTDQQTQAQALLELSIPYIDKLDSKTYCQLLKDYGDHLQDFRKLWREYVSCKARSDQDALHYLRNIKSEIDALSHSDSHVRFRDVIATLGGVLGFTATVVSAISGDGSAVMAAAGSILGATKSAADVHQKLREQKAQHNARIRASPYALFWKLGLANPRRTTNTDARRLGAAPQQKASAFDDTVDSHWLCPPTCGVKDLVLKEEQASNNGLVRTGDPRTARQSAQP